MLFIKNAINLQKHINFFVKVILLYIQEIKSRIFNIILTNIRTIML